MHAARPQEIRSTRPTLTSTLVAAARGVGSDPPDTLAQHLVPRPLAPLMRASSWVPSSVLRLATLGFVDHMELRTQVIDDALRVAAVQGMVPQLVILGAGLDSRGYRMPELANSVVFEVERPSSQAYKRDRLGTRAPTAKEVRFCPLDLAEGTLESALVGQGHRTDVPTFWVAEGLLPYLPMPAIHEMMKLIGDRSAPASRAALTYATPEMTALGRLVGIAALRVFEVIGEPLHGLLSPRQVAAMLAEIGYSELQDESVLDWARRFGRNNVRMTLIDERSVLAEKRAGETSGAVRQ